MSNHYIRKFTEEVNARGYSISETLYIRGTSVSEVVLAERKVRQMRYILAFQCNLTYEKEVLEYTPSSEVMRHSFFYFDKTSNLEKTKVKNFNLTFERVLELLENANLIHKEQKKD